MVKKILNFIVNESIRKLNLRLPYDANMFKLRSGSKEDVIKLMIQSENVHLLLIFLSYIPIFWGMALGHWSVMIAMAVVFSVIHIPFVIVQRFNLPRIINAKLPFPSPEE
ncbi:MAG: hypothetical protein MJ182_10920 [Treponema sp.]|nr:hypothetical protein [Treponema sp.]